MFEKLNSKRLTIYLLLAILLCSTFNANSVYSQAMPPTMDTIKSNEKIYSELNFKDKQDFIDAHKGFIAPLMQNQIKNSKGAVIWDQDQYSIINDGPAPLTVNPSLWRQAQLLDTPGLYKVVDGVYQIRGQDVSVMTIVEGRTGLIILDTLSTTETAKAAMELYYANRPNKPVSTVVISHSHADHFGGIKGVLQYAANPEKVPIIAPLNFSKEVVSENILLGNIMSRRAGYMFGMLLPVNKKGYVTNGIGPRLSKGTISFLPPTIEIKDKVQTMKIDGVQFKFLLTLNTEAPSEMHYYINDYKTLVVAKNTGHTMHNFYTLRGAKTRDASEWVKALDDTIKLFGIEEIEALITAHSWPLWGKNRVIDHLSKQRDLYKYIHDQTVRLANQGYTADEIAEQIKLPGSLDKYWANRGYYGNLKQNAKAVYNYYLGYFNGNPSDLDPLPQVESGTKYVQYMGGEKKILKLAKADFEKGEYRWVAQVLKNVVMANPNNKKAKNLLAKSYEQLGYQSESAAWRNYYLTGAEELRKGIVKLDGSQTISTVDPQIILSMEVNDFFDYISITLNGPKASHKNFTFNVNITDLNTNYTIDIKNAVFNYSKGLTTPNSDASLSVDKVTFYLIMLGKLDVNQAIESGKLNIKGNKQKLIEMLNLFDHFNQEINIVTP
ncbi:alkyl sulfatase dimerization domain-containing protein [Bacillus sp. UNCCL81]|uniref:alkyl/aryl-sulfatase n=1 Tax=Bacillus sp. UNCCL81 TaxID=1502755 RepID=UPI0008E79E97|nr:alkyl sulfatase dimerization domain-containing protein [Bacillus sp. UNCCL81]SFC69695.1 Alkyl sulfatase BDS1, metallo-beta-lactamase superfamily [Bacillus sp. UNCCL81]